MNTKMQTVVKMCKVCLPLERRVPLRDRGFTGVLSAGGGGGGGGETESASFLRIRGVGSPSSSELKSES